MLGRAKGESVVTVIADKGGKRWTEGQMKEEGGSCGRKRGAKTGRRERPSDGRAQCRKGSDEQRIAIVFKENYTVVHSWVIYHRALTLFPSVVLGEASPE